jgi:hypothetical protein
MAAAGIKPGFPILVRVFLTIVGGATCGYFVAFLAGVLWLLANPGYGGNQAGLIPIFVTGPWGALAGIIVAPVLLIGRLRRV